MQKNWEARAFVSSHTCMYKACLCEGLRYLLLKPTSVVLTMVTAIVTCFGLHLM